VLIHQSKPRVCVVEYLNTVPLVWGMLHGDQRDLFDLSFALPSECADRLAQGTADIGIVPSIELTRQTLDIIRGAGIACRGPVRSILLISKVPFTGIRTLAADSGSRTSVALSRVILSRRYGVEPQLRSERPDLVQMLDHADACLIIGDPALLLDPADIPFHVLDLGAEWTLMTGLPMVFAVWAARPDSPQHDPQPFIDSLQFGLAHLDAIIREEHAKRRITSELAREYLTRHIVFKLGDAEYQGLERFLEYALELPNSSKLIQATV
jgi:chorismate dehydratase